LKILSSINLSWGHVRSHKKFMHNRFSRFDVYWIQKKTDRKTEKQTDTLTSKVKDRIGEWERVCALFSMTY